MSSEQKTNHGLTFAYCLLFSLVFGSYFFILPVTLNLLLTTATIIYIGSHRSLILRDHEHPLNEERDVMSAQDAYKFPLVGSCTLFGLFLAFKFFKEDIVNLLLSVYFSFIGTFLLAVSIEPFVSLVLTSEKKYGKEIKGVPLLGDVDLTFTFSDLVCYVLGGCFAFMYFKTKHWVMNNIFGVAFCIQGLERISIGSYKIGAILLIGLFFYDIFWVFGSAPVFGTSVMVDVAKKFDAPIKLLFPRVFASEGVKAEFSMLGLGDIVIPGIFIALLIRYDAHKYNLDLKADPFAVFPKPFFHATLIGYFVGLLFTVWIMFYFSAAQPALLYLVPACLGFSGMTAAIRGEFKSLYAYSEEEEDMDSKEEEKAKEGKKEK